MPTKLRSPPVQLKRFDIVFHEDIEDTAMQVKAFQNWQLHLFSSLSPIFTTFEAEKNDLLIGNADINTFVFGDN